MGEGIMIAVIAAIVLVNLFSFFLMGFDKRRAKQNGRRVPEKKLFLAAACFGAVGGTAGMKHFHHKTKHWYFRVFFPLMAVVQLALLVAGVYVFFIE